MLRPLTLTPASAGTPIGIGGQPLIASHAQIASIVRSRLGQGHADLLATPQPQADGQIAWATSAAGDIVPMAQLSEAERQAVLQRAERLATEMRGLAGALRAEGSTSALVGEMIELAVQWPVGEWIYSVGGKPVAVMWGQGEPAAGIGASAAAAGSSLRATGPRTASAVLPARNAELVDAAAARMGLGEAQAAAAASAAAAAAQPVTSAAAPRRSTAMLWLAWLVLLLAALAFMAWSYTRYLANLEQQRGSRDAVASAQAAIKSLEDEIRRKQSLTSQLVCVAPPPPPPVQTVKAPEPPPEPDDPKAPVKPPAKAVPITEAKNLCPGDRPKEQAPELAIVFDASGSMAYSLNATDQDIRAADQMQARDAMAAMMRQLRGQAPIASSAQSVLAEPTRITTARQAAVAVVQRAPSDMSIGLVTIEDCNRTRSAGFFAPARRSELASRLRAITPVGGTPLADGVAQGGRLLDGVRRESLMVVISDGVESCGGNPCAVAAQLARAKPHLKINVVDITGTGAGNCLAQATGGKVFTARNAGEVAAMTARAAQDVMGPASCRKP